MNLKNIHRLLIILLSILFPLTTHASFIESTIGTAVINDASASYYNPAALTLLKNSQIIALGTTSYYHNSFTGQTTQILTGFTQSGTANTLTNYYLPAIYIGIPTTNKITLGLAIVANFFNNNIEEPSILRYAQSSNNVRDLDLVPAIGIKFNDIFSAGAGVNFSTAHFLLQRTSGFPTLDVPDSLSRNETSGHGIGGDIGLLIKPSLSTIIGFNYRTSITYHLSGKSVFEGTTEVVSNNYSFTFWTPARSVLTVAHFVTPRLGFLATVQYIQWSIIKNINVNGIAAQIGPVPTIINASLPFHMRDTWLVTLGSQYRISPKWIVRVASSYVETPGNSHYQLANGNSIVAGVSTGYDVNKYFTIDGSYAHAFMQNQSIHIATPLNTANGVNKGYIDSVSLKLTFNI